MPNHVPKEQNTKTPKKSIEEDLATNNTANVAFANQRPEATTQLKFQKMADSYTSAYEHPIQKKESQQTSIKKENIVVQRQGPDEWRNRIVRNRISNDKRRQGRVENLRPPEKPAPLQKEEGLQKVQGEGHQPTKLFTDTVSKLAIARGWLDPVQYYDPNALSKAKKLRTKNDNKIWPGLHFGYDPETTQNVKIINDVYQSVEFSEWLASLGLVPNDIKTLFQRVSGDLSMGEVHYVGNERGGAHGEQKNY